MTTWSRHQSSEPQRKEICKKMSAGSLKCIKDYQIHIGILLLLSSISILLALFYESSHTEGLKIGILLSPEDSVDLLRGILDELTQVKMSDEPFVAFHRDYNSLLENFKRSNEIGMDYLIINANRSELRLLCEYIDVTSTLTPTIWSFQSPPSNCLGKVRTMDAPFEAHLMVLVDRLLQAKILKVIIISGDTLNTYNQFLLHIFLKNNIEVLFSAAINDGEFLIKNQLKEYLTKYPHVPLLATSVKDLFRVIRFFQNTNLLNNRMILSYTDPSDAIRIVRSEVDRHKVEKLMLYTTARHNQDVAKFEEYSISRNAISYFMDNLNSLNRPRDVLNNNFLEQKYVIELLRFVPDVLRSYIMQDHPLFLEQVVHLSFFLEKNTWLIHKVENSIFKILTKIELVEISKNEDCEPTHINITATENYRLKRISSSFDISTIPIVLLIPNSNPDGFIIKIQCSNPDENDLLEIGCFGTSFVNKSVECLAAKNTEHRRRITRSYTSNHIIPIDRKENVDHSYTMMNMMKVNRMSGIIPQVAGCVGASGGCSICFLFLQFIVPDGNAGVCYGACAVGIGGACTSFIATGLQRSIDFTVICSELFYQGHIDIISYMADAQFGSILTRKNPMALKGYQIAATPLVYLMRKSPKLSKLVHQFAIPWIHHMEYVVHLKDTDNSIGHILTAVGLPVFSFLGFCFANVSFLLPLSITYLILKKTNRPSKRIS